MPTTEPSGRRSRKKAIEKCRTGSHRYGASKPIGGGIIRQVCLACGAVTIDIRQAQQPSNFDSENDHVR